MSILTPLFIIITSNKLFPVISNSAMIGLLNFIFIDLRAVKSFQRAKVAQVNSILCLGQNVEFGEKYTIDRDPLNMASRLTQCLGRLGKTGLSPGFRALNNNGMLQIIAFYGTRSSYASEMFVKTFCTSE